MRFLVWTDPPSDVWAARLAPFYQPISQFSACEWELDCVDCHASGQVMGDGDLHSQMAEVRSVECRTCHGTPTEAPLTRRIIDPHDLAMRQAGVHPSSALE